MPLIKGENSYVDLADADYYFEDRLDSSAWTEASDIQKERALITATSMLDEFEWIGQVIDPQQPLAFPRTGYYFDRKLGMEVALNPTPARLSTATYELAYHLLNNDNINDTTGSVKSITVGPISITNIISTSKVPSSTKTVIKDMLSKGYGKAWWRAN